MTTVFVKPSGTTQVRDPDDPLRRPLPAEGREVPANAYWLRRLADGDVVRVMPVAKPRKEK
ncbi:MAG: DUF2635 domain-containing protein [Rhodospirillaceae bacterium]|nr:DUF2635 domain-containing protein [Rhodospirillaceae bacterium]